MHPVPRTPKEPSGADPVVRWRTRRLRDAGFSAHRAEALARDPAYDLHAVLRLVDLGCPAELAVRILAPLDREPPPC
jgi:hypothetical protein